MVWTLLIVYGIVAVATIILQAAFGGEVRELFVRAPRPSEAALVVDVALGVGFGLLVVVLSRIVSIRFAWARRLEAEFRELLRPVTARDVAPLSAVGAFAEELFFRGFLQPLLGLVPTSLLFGLAHIPSQRHLIPWTILAAIMGLAFGWLFQERGTLLAPFLAHFTINYFNFHHLLRPRSTEAAS